MGLARRIVAFALVLGGCAGSDGWIDDGLPDPIEADTTGVRAYAVGSTPRLTPHARSGISPEQYHVRSLDPAVLETTVLPASAGGEVHVDARAVAPGTARLRLVRNSDSADVYEETVEVRLPTSARLYSQTRHGPYPAATPVRVDAVRLLDGGGAAVDVRLYDGEVPLRSNIPVDAMSSLGCARGTDADSHGSGTGRALVVNPTCVGPAELDVWAAGRSLATLHVDVLPSSALAGIVIDGPDESAFSAGTKLVLTVSATDGAGAPIEVAGFYWQRGTPDALGLPSFPYIYEPSETLTVTVEFGDVSTTTTVHGHAVPRPHDIWCSVVGHGGPLAAVVLATGLALARRRRRLGP